MFRRYYAPLCNYTNEYLESWEKAQEIVQNTFLKLWHNWDALEKSSSRKSYIFRMLKNEILDGFNTDTEKEKKSDTYQKMNQESPDVIHRYLIHSEILNSINKLKPKIRKVFVLHKFEGLSYSEVAQYLKISKESVEDKLAKAVRSLRTDLMEMKF